MFDGIYYGQPINWSNPLNRNLVSWHLALPWWYGGMRLVDLRGRFPLTLTNGAVWSNANAGGIRPGGFGCITLDGTNDFIAHANPATFFDFTGGNFAVCFWMRSTGPTGSLVSTIHHSSGFGGWEIAYQLGGAGNLEFWNGGGWVAAAVGSSVLADGNWHYVCVSMPNGGPVEFYIDGFSYGTAACSNPTAHSGTLCVGGRNSQGSAGTCAAISVDDIRIMGRALKGGEPRMLAQMARRGWPGVLNRLAMHRWEEGTVTTGVTYPQLERLHPRGTFRGVYVGA